MPQEPQTDPKDTQDPTPAGSGDAGTTPPAADANAGTTPPDAEPKDGTPDDDEQPQDVEKIVTKRLERAKKKWQTELEDERKKAEMSEAEKHQARAKELEAELEQERTNAKRERTLRGLTGKVIDADDALVIAERLDLVDDDGAVDVPALLKAKPYLAPKQAGGDVDLPGSRSVKGQHADVAALEAELGKARTRTERIALQRRINETKKGK